MRLPTRSLGGCIVDDDGPAASQRAQGLREYSLDLLRAEFSSFSPSPLLGRWTSAIAEDPEVLRLATRVHFGQSIPRLFFTCAHHLLIRGAPGADALRQSLEGDGAYPAFRAFCLRNADALADMVAARRVQTNEPGRSALLLPALAAAAAMATGRPLALVEVGAAGGLNLLCDRYACDYGPAGVCTPANPALTLGCTPRGSVAPPVPDTPPAITWRVGIDLYPLRAADPEDAAWLEAQVPWGTADFRARTARIRAAAAAVRSDPPRLVAADALDALPDVLADVPPEVVPCVVHAHTTYQFGSRTQHRRLDAIIEQVGRRRDIFHLQNEPGTTDWLDTEQKLLCGAWFLAGEKGSRLFGLTDGYGEWLAWAPHSLTEEWKAWVRREL